VSKQDLDDAVAVVADANASVAVAKANLEAARINLDHTKITAPIDGRIGKSTLTPGALVTASQTIVLTTIRKVDPIYVDVTQSNVNLLKLRRALQQGRLSPRTLSISQYPQIAPTTVRVGANYAGADA
jgi:membrane fusion protein, multidrug efflux system